MAFDITPGFNLGISDALRRVGSAAGSFVGSKESNPIFKNPTGQSSSNKKSDKDQYKYQGYDESTKSTAEQQAASNASLYGGYGGSGGASGGGSGSDYSAEDLAYLDSQANSLRNLLSRSGNTLNQGLSNLNDSYNREVSSANQQRSRALEDFGTQREDTTRAKQEALGKIDTNARVLNDSIRRLLGLASGSGSSAYQYAAPNAVARQASGERNNVLSDYAENDRNIALSEKRAGEDFATLLDDLARQRNQKESDLRSGVLENEQGINEQLANIAAQRVAATGGGYGATMAAQRPYADAISSRQSQIDALFDKFRSPMLTAKAVDVQTPQLRDYIVDKAGVTQNQASQQQYSPYSSFLRKNNDEQV